MTSLDFKLTCDDTLENNTIALPWIACHGQADTGFSSFITLKLREQQLCIHNASQQLLKTDYLLHLSAYSARDLSAPIRL